MSLETIIPPEIIADELAGWLTKLAQRPDVKTILEIGSSSGDGSTQAIVNGMLEAEHDQELFTVEMSRARYEACKARYASLPFVHCFHGSAVPLEGYIDADDVATFYHDFLCNIQKYPLSQVLGWLRQDLEACAACPDHHVIKTIQEGCGLVDFDMVLLDGSAFTGFAELKEVYGAKLIVLDDVLDLKHWNSASFLSSDVGYKLVASNLFLRNGYAIFERVK